MKRKLFLFSFILSLGSMSFAQTDDTNAYVSNSSFEADAASLLPADVSKDDGLRGYTLNPPSGWSVSGTDVVKLLVTPECFTDNNFGKVTRIADGNQAYYLRMGWSTGTTTLSQMIPNLPAGRYELAASIRSAYANSASSTYSLFANDERTTYTFEKGSAGYFTTDSWQTAKVNFTVDADGEVKLGVTVNWKSGGSCIIIDHFVLKRLGDAGEPAVVGEWQTMIYDFCLDHPADVDISLGYATSASVGAANNTYLYIDHLRLLRADDPVETGISTPAPPRQAGRVIYDLSGRPFHLAGKGIVVQDGKKILLK